MFTMAYPIAVLIEAEWEQGILLLGIQTILIALFLFCIKCSSKTCLFLQKKPFILMAWCIIASLFPITLSLYIEFINILVGQGAYVIHLREGYMILISLMIVAGFVLTKKLSKKTLFDERKFVYPTIVYGVSMLSVQLPLTGSYSADLFESANASILITDYLNFGSIPIVEHYGGHMMTSVWEGILYGLLNNDYTRAAYAAYTPNHNQMYGVYIVPFIAVLFYYLIKYIWNADMALWVALLFPFYRSWEAYGQGMLIIIAVIAFLKQNSYFRAVLIWLACAWCTLYRLDLGVAFDVACAVALICYVIYEKNWQAAKKLLITFTEFIMVVAVAWCILCLTKSINPVSRLAEFVKISASNSNWARGFIGNSGSTSYSWCYFYTNVDWRNISLYNICKKV